MGIILECSLFVVDGFELATINLYKTIQKLPKDIVSRIKDMQIFINQIIFKTQTPKEHMVLPTN
ncbi:hypothetical protein CCY97_03445 [Helicobacter sp. 10-6591]|nr:hypothetical protein CCY97_03445 [Helicobacter sp. 10-6591]